MIKETSAQEARDEIAIGIEHSFGQLAQPAVAKAEIIDANAATIVALMKALAKITATCKVLTTTDSTLVTALAKCGGKTVTNPPPGYSGTGTAATGHAVNTAGVVFPTRIGIRIGNVIFTRPHACSTCGLPKVYHLPKDCMELPENAGRKAAMKAQATAQKTQR